MVKDAKTWGVSIKNFIHAWQILGVKEEVVVVVVVEGELVKKGNSYDKNVLLNNFELSSTKLSKMISADIKADAT